MRIRLAAAFGLVLAFVAGTAAADWTPVGGTPSIFTAYADKASIKRSGDGVQMLGLYDLLMADLSADGQPYGSTVVLREYDCREKRVRLLAYVDYAGHMGQGRVVSPVGAKGPDHWDPVVPGALDETLLAIACGGAGTPP